MMTPDLTHVHRHPVTGKPMMTPLTGGDHGDSYSSAVKSASRLSILEVTRTIPWMIGRGVPEDAVRGWRDHLAARCKRRDEQMPLAMRNA